MASLVLGAAGAAIGSVIPGVGTAAGWAIGSALGAVLFPPKGPDGPRLNDLAVQTSSYGQDLARSWATTRRAGNVIWAADLVEHATEQDGKGGPSSTTYSYTCSFAVSFGEIRPGQVARLRRLWVGGKLLYDASTSNQGPTVDWRASGSSSKSGRGFVFYTGSETQGVDPTIQAAVGNTPAYRGQAYVVFTDLELEKYGNRIPFDTQAEIVIDGTLSNLGPMAIGTGYSGAMQPGTPYFYGTIPTTAVDQSTVYINDIFAKTVVKTIVVGIHKGERVDYVLPTDEIWIANRNPGSSGVEVASISAAAWAANRTIEVTASALIWLGNIRYCETTREIYLSSVNGTSYAIGILTTSGALIASLDGGFIVEDFQDMPDVGLIVGVGSAALSGGTQSMVVIDPQARAIIYQFVATDFGVPPFSTSHCAVDSVRNRVMWINRDAWSFFYLVSVNTSTAAFFVPSGLLAVFSEKITFPAAFTQNLSAIMYHKGLDRFIVQGTTNTYVVNPVTFAVESTINQGQGALFLYEVDGINEYVLATLNNVLYRYYLSDAIAVSKVAVSTIITDLSSDVGLTGADIDVTDLTGVLCDGFLLARQGSARSAIEQLMMAYQLDAVESGGKVKYVRRGAATTTVIDADRLAIYEDGQEVPAAVQLSRADEVELPRSLTVKYMNFGADHQIGAQSAIRQTVRSVNDVTWDLPVVMNDAHAKSVTDAGMYSAWAARTKAKFSTTLKYADKEPTDLVTVENNLIRISKRTLKGNMLEFEGALDSGMVFAGGAASGLAQSVAQTIPYRSSTAIEFMDIPALRDVDNDAGFYVAASGYPNTVWDGCVIFKSSDGGGSWAEVATLTTASTIGAATTALGTFSQNVFDEFNTVTVHLRNGTLSSISELAVLNGGNAALLGSEIIQFRTATLNGDGTYTLSGLLRARKGTSASGHAIGDRFVFLNTTSVRRIDMSTAEIGLERLYKAVSIGDSLSSARSVAFTNTAVGLECLSPVLLGGGRNAAGDLTITAVRRTRIGGEWRDYADAPLSEASESYEVEIWNSTFTTLKRTLPAVSSPSASYTSAQQVTDWGSNQATVYVRFYQLSATVGRGFVLQGTV